MAVVRAEADVRFSALSDIRWGSEDLRYGEQAIVKMVSRSELGGGTSAALTVDDAVASPVILGCG